MVLTWEQALVWTHQRLLGQRDGRLTGLQENDSLGVMKSHNDRLHHGLILKELLLTYELHNKCNYCGLWAVNCERITALHINHISHCQVESVFKIYMMKLQHLTF